MDGVFVDLDKSMFEMFGEEHSDIVDHKGKYFKYLSVFVDRGGFTTAHAMPKHEDLDAFFYAISQLKNANVKMEILTSHGSFYRPGGVDRHDVVVEQKKEWLKANTQYLKTIPFNYSSSGKHKSDWAHSDSMLIDDTENNVNYFLEKGGKSFHYVNESCLSEMAFSVLKFIEMDSIDNIMGNFPELCAFGSETTADPTYENRIVRI